jgi:ketosteroid isomerase-like protein
MRATLDVASVQHALDALVTGDSDAATRRFTNDVVFNGVGGRLRGRITGLVAVLDRFDAIAKFSHGTFGTEVEAVFTDDAGQLIVVTRHWATVDGQPMHGIQALLLTIDSNQIRTIDAFSLSGCAPSGIWD